MLLIQNANVFAPEHIGMKDLLVGAGKILAIEDKIEPNKLFQKTWDAEGKKVTPGFIDQHIHVIGAGGKRGFASMSPELNLSDLISCGTTTINSLLGTDGSTRSIHSLYAKVKALEMEGISTSMFTGYYGLDPVYLTDSVQNDMIFIDKVVGCKIAISDVRSSYPTELDLLRLLRQVRVGGMLGNKKGILHLHLGNLDTKMDVLFKLIKEYQFPIKHISPTHVGRTKALFEQAIEFGKLGGIIDITTGASKYTDPYKSVLYGLEKGLGIDFMSFSSDGNAGLDKLDENGNFIGFRRAPNHENLEQAIKLVTDGNLSLSDAIKPITTVPAQNLGLANKGKIAVGMDADFCTFDESYQLLDVFAMGKQMMGNQKLMVKNAFE